LISVGLVQAVHEDLHLVRGLTTSLGGSIGHELQEVEGLGQLTLGGEELGVVAVRF